MSVHCKLYDIFNTCRLASLSLRISPSTITVKPIPLSRNEPTYAHDLILPLPCFSYLKHFSRNPERKHLDEIEMCAHNIIASLFFYENSLATKKITAAFSFFSTSDQKGVNDPTSNSLGILCGHKADAFG